MIQHIVLPTVQLEQEQTISGVFADLAVVEGCPMSMNWLNGAANRFIVWPINNGPRVIRLNDNVDTM